MSTRAAARYAKALLALAQEQNSADPVMTDMQSIAQTLAENSDLANVLASPVVRSSAKNEILNTLFPKANISTKSLFKTLLENKRMPILGEVAKTYQRFYDNLTGKQVALVTTAVPMDKALQTKVHEKIKALTGHEATIKNKVDSSIVGGFILRIGDVQYNASVANNIHKLKRTFTLQ